MKKFLILFSAFAMTVVGCTRFIEETPTPRVYVDSPAIVAAVTDSALTATVTPASGTGYYSVVVTEGEAKALDSMKVFKLSVSGALYAKTVSAASAATQQISLDDLDPNTDYTVYAVSASTQGSVGKLVSKTVRTTDKVAPFITDIMVTSDTLVTVTFSEEVEFGENIGETVKYYALNKGIYDDTPMGILDHINITVVGVGNKVTFDISGLPAGAYYNLAFPEGAFLDLAGNGCAALEHSPFTKDTKGPVNASKASGRNSTVPFELSIYGGQPVTVVTAMNSPIWMSIPEGVVIAKNHSLEAGVNGSLIYMTGSEDEGYAKIETFATSGKTYDFGWNGTYNCALAYPNAGEYYTGRKDPERGSYVLMGIPSYLEDIYGNMNAEFAIGPFLYSYGYTLNDVIGKYDVQATSYFQGATTTSMTIEKSDDAESGNVMITEIFGDPVDSDLRLYADFDTDLGILTIPDWQKIWYSSKYEGYWTFAVNGADYVTLSMPKSGNLTSPSAWFGYYIDIDSGGWGNIFTTYDAVKSTSTSSVAPASATVRTILSVGKEIR